MSRFHRSGSVQGREDNMNCTQCGNTMEKSTTTFTVSRKGMMYVMEDVPCWECPVCESSIFEAEVAKKLERYSSGRFSTYRFRQALVFKWGEPMIEMQTKPLEVSLQNTPLDLGMVGTGR